MTTFFNLDNLEKEATKCNTSILHVLEAYYYKRIPKNSRSVRFQYSILSGYCFILNPEPLFKDLSTDIAYKVQYIKLAARRDYLFYKQYNYKGLQLSYFPDLNLEAIKTNPLLQITNTEILFLYEERKTKWL
jgi:hypothetical protein